VDKFMTLCANLVRRNCPDEIMELVGYALRFEKEIFQLLREVSDKSVEISRLKAENEFLRRTLEESENTD